jgi:uncharacterized BrkB/YihY/UPF0761 family membrane protein
MSSSRTHFVLNNPLQFIKQVFNGFRANQGFLLSGAIAYYTLLSIIPMIALILVMLSQFQEPQKLLEVLREYLALVTPGQVDVVVNQVEVFLENWKVIGVLGFALLLFFGHHSIYLYFIVSGRLTASEYGQWVFTFIKSGVACFVWLSLVIEQYGNSFYLFTWC